MRTTFIKFILAIPLLCLVFPAISFAGTDDYQPIFLWDGYKVKHGKDVQLYVCQPENPKDIGLIVCPGGSYHWLDEDGEGLEVGEWLADHGYTAFVLMYRTAGRAEIAWHTRLIFRGKRHPDMISDAQRALQYVREHAKDYGIDPARTGMLGFSAGGHLALSAACFSESDFIGEGAGADLRPAFVGAIYPVVTMYSPYCHVRSRRGLLGDNRVGSKKMKDSLSIERHIPGNCPPVFLVNCKDDPVVPYQNSVLLDSALTAQGVEHTYIQYSRGKHGFGVSDHFGSPECRRWRDEFLKWMEGLYCPSL